MTDSLVMRLKAELKRSLRKHVGEAVNDVCNAFVDELKPVEPLPPAPTLGSNGNDVDYECCRRLVEYIIQMETSPGFAQQIDCVILAYQSNASVDILNSVVTQNLWVRRKIVGSGEGEKNNKTESKPAAEILPIGFNNVSQKYIVDVEGCNLVVGAKVPKSKVEKTDEVKAKISKVSANVGKTAPKTVSDIVNNARGVANKVLVYQSVAPQRRFRVNRLIHQLRVM